MVEAGAAAGSPGVADVFVAAGVLAVGSVAVCAFVSELFSPQDIAKITKNREKYFIIMM